MKTFITALAFVLATAVPASAASWVLTWTQTSGEVADKTELERAPVVSGRCGTFAKIAEVPFGTLTYTDSTAPSGFLCYRARNVASVDPGDGSPIIAKASAYSNVDSTKPGNPKNFQAP